MKVFCKSYRLISYVTITGIYMLFGKIRLPS
jgi:hypothetical protein